MSFEKSVKRIDQRDWEIIRDKWLSYIPDYSYTGQAPEHQILEFVGLDGIFKRTSSSPGEYKEEVPLLRQSILREAIYLIHKSTHVCGSANIHLENGVLSWGISSAYQSAFFALKGILGLLGLSFPRMNSALMIDCFPEEEKLSSNQRKRGEKPKAELKFVIFPALTHTHMWQIFQRVLTVSSVNLWKPEIVAYLRNISPTQFAEQRNSLHYVNNYWLFPKDLFNRLFDDSFGADNLFSDKLSYSDLHNRKDFSFFLNYILLNFSFLLIEDIGKYSTAVKSEYDLIQHTLKEGIHKRFLQSIV